MVTSSNTAPSANKYKNFLDRLKKYWNDSTRKIAKQSITQAPTAHIEKIVIEPRYLPLTPNDEADLDNGYSKMIEYALSKSAIKNIAVTGPYGSGKSSVLLTFQKKNPKKWKYLNISLATFKDRFDSEESPEKIKQLPDDNDTQTVQKVKSVEIEAIEKSILQQLFYSVPQKKLPRSRLKRIVTVNPTTLLGATLLFSLWFLSLLIIFAPANKFFSILAISSLIASSFVKLCSLLIFSLLSFHFIYLTFKYIELIQELKFKFQDTELTLSNKANDSILNTYLDEVLYFFEKTKTNVLIIEDLDRFNDPEIFIRLRELNTLINTATKEKQHIKILNFLSSYIPLIKRFNQQIVFIYAIKDDMFIDKDRTKFFDFIVPIIPIINPTNSYDFIKDNYINEIINKDLNDEIDDSLLNQASLYFDDKRLVVNIFNEFNLYAKKLNKIKLNKNELLALMIYKNYHPQDFSDLHSNTGNLYNLFKETKNQLKKKSACFSKK